MSEMQDVVQALNEALSNNLIDSYDIESLPEEFGPLEVVFAERVGYDYDTFKKVMYLKAYDIYVAIDGYYSSYDGTDYSGAQFYEVKPVQKTITVYE